MLIVSDVEKLHNKSAEIFTNIFNNISLYPYCIVNINFFNKIEYTFDEAIAYVEYLNICKNPYSYGLHILGLKHNFKFQYKVSA